jgi:hypothetical protein
MASIDEVITELKRLSPQQVDQVARLIHGLSRTAGPEAPRGPAIPADVINEAVRHGWPVQLFAELIGSLPDIERAGQPPLEERPEL